MSRWRLTKLLAVAVAGLALAAGTVAAVAAATDDGDSAQQAEPRQETDENGQPWLGVVVRPSDEPAGLAVRHVAPESPAAEAGLQPGDVITAIDGQAVAEFEELAAAIKAKAIGDSVTLSVVKGGIEEPEADATEVEVTLAARPEPERVFGDIGEKIGEAFDRFVDGQFRYLDEDGNVVTLEVFAGTVSSLSEGEITLDINGDEGEKSFSIPDGVEVPEKLEAGDRAAVLVKDGEVEQVLPGGFPFPLPGLVPDVLPAPEGGFRLPFGEAMSVEVITGTVSGVSAGEVTLDVGDDQGGKTFSVPDGVEVPEGLEAGEQATVILEDGEVAKIVEGGLPMEGEFRFPFDGEGGIFPRPFRGFDGCPCQEIEPEEGAVFPEA